MDRLTAGERIEVATVAVLSIIGGVAFGCAAIFAIDMIKRRKSVLR